MTPMPGVPRRWVARPPTCGDACFSPSPTPLGTRIAVRTGTIVPPGPAASLRVPVPAPATGGGCPQDRGATRSGTAGRPTRVSPPCPCLPAHPRVTPPVRPPQAARDREAVIGPSSKGREAASGTYTGPRDGLEMAGGTRARPRGCAWRRFPGDGWCLAGVRAGWCSALGGVGVPAQAEAADGLLDGAGLHLAGADQCFQGGDDNGFGVDLEVPAQRRPGVGAAVAVGAE